MIFSGLECLSHCAATPLCEISARAPHAYGLPWGIIDQRDNHEQQNDEENVASAKRSNRILNDFPALNDVQQDRDDGDDQQNMNDSTCAIGEKTNCPTDNEDDSHYIEQVSHCTELYSAGKSSAKFQVTISFTLYQETFRQWRQRDREKVRAGSQLRISTSRALRRCVVARGRLDVSTDVKMQ
jgi:hypothetical protein